MPTERASPEQRQFARNLRGQLTDCERLLCRQLRNRGLAGFKFFADSIRARPMSWISTVQSCDL